MGSQMDHVRGERDAAVAYLRRYAQAERKRAQAMRADAGTQAETEARGVERIALAMEHAADGIQAGRHWR